MICSLEFSHQAVHTNSHFVQIKIVAILTFLYLFTHQNNTNYIPLIIGFYLYSASDCVDAITSPNHLQPSVSYDALQNKHWKLSHFGKQWIKSQQSNKKLVGTWDNFEFQENVTSESVGNKLKFCSITIALFVVKGWRIPKQ